MPGAANDIRMLAIDLDGTVLGRGDIDPRDVAAVQAARDAGIEVVVATGRSWFESRRALRQLDLDGVMVAAGGASTHDARTGRTLARTIVSPDVITLTTNVLVEHGFLVNLLQDAGSAGFDYWMVGTADMHAATSWWMHEHELEARWVDGLAEVDSLEHTLRVGAVAAGRDFVDVASQLREELGDRALIQHWKAVVESDEHDPDEAIHLFEGFHPSVDKWTMISSLLEDRGLEACHVAAIGDGLNDIGMLRNAGLGIAMGNAEKNIQAEANEVTGPLGGGVADAIGRILTSR
ncbi:MAG: Cof-type HAD-IIB family hydrolase [Phycisphaerales bacterium]|nr:Cof-type HAD-IIB family hydrolase [Phycisphaerales bacterium]